MLGLIVTLVIVFAALTVLLWTGTALAQGYVYDSPTDGLPWRAPAAAGALTLFLALWTFMDYANPGGTDTIFNYSSEQLTEVPKFWSIRKGDRGEEEILFERHVAGTRPEYRDANGHVWSRSSSGMMVAIIVEEKKGDETVKTRFNAEMKDGKFAPRAPRGVEQSLRYIEENGSRFMPEDQLGKIVSYRRGRLFLVVLLNAVHFAIWFAVLWPLLRFQWAHALGFAFIGWLVLTLALVPYLLTTSRTAAAKKHAARPAVTTSFEFRASRFA